MAEGPVEPFWILIAIQIKAQQHPAHTGLLPYRLVRFVNLAALIEAGKKASRLFVHTGAEPERQDIIQ